MVVLENPWGRAQIRPQGAQVLSYVPAGGRDLLWVSPAALWGPGEPVRGGVPLCVPWFAGRYPGKPMHGFGRNQVWRFDAPATLPDGRSRVTFRLEDNAETRALWPAAFLWEQEVTLGPSLELVFRAWNRGEAPVEFEMVWHTYFSVEHISQVRVTGLEGCSFLDKNRARAQGVQTGPLAPLGPTDLLFPHAGPRQILDDGTRRIEISSDAAGAVVWNAGDNDRNVPDLGAGTHLGYVCVERGTLDASATTLAPGVPWEIRMSLSQEAKS